MGNIRILEFLDRIEIAQFQFRHAAAGFFFHQPRGDLVVREHFQQIVTDARLVVIHVAGGINRRFARCALAIFDREFVVRSGILTECVAGVFRQDAVFVYAQYAVHDGARGRRFVQRVHRLHYDGNGCELTQRIGTGEQLVAECSLAFFEFNRFRAQHQMREIEVPFMRRHIGALGHEAQVAQIALIYNLHVIFGLHPIHFQRGGVVD